MLRMVPEAGSRRSLHAEISRVRRRWLLLGAAIALVWALAAAIVLALAGVWLDLVWELSPQARIAASIVAAAGAILLLATLAVFTVRSARDAILARRLDRARASGGAILTGLELSQGFDVSAPTSLTAGLARAAVQHAAVRAAEVASGRAVPARPLVKLLSAFCPVLLAIVLVAVAAPDLSRTQWLRFRWPFADVPPYSLTKFTVEPGDVNVVYGSELDVFVTVRGTPVDQVELVLEVNGQSETVPMFPEGPLRWRAVLSRVAQPSVYYARAHRARSTRYQIRVLTVPQIEDVRVRITPPAYTHQAAYEGPLPKDGVAGLPGARVRLTARSNRPLVRGRIALTGQGPTSAAPMEPASPGSLEAVGEFAIAGDGKFAISLTDVQQQTSQQPFAGAITLLADHRPLIVLVQPPNMSQATPTAALPVEILAEDDYGVARVELYRSWNDSRPLPLRLATADPPTRRVHEVSYLPLAKYGLEPGDVIKFFGRVEDNDPAGGKGSESAVVTVEIIAQEDFDRMVRTRMGLELLQSKYAEAQRRMEALAQQIAALQEKLRRLPPSNPASNESRNELARLAERFDKEAEAIRRLGENNLPFDIDQFMAPQLKELADLSAGTAEELRQLAARQALPSGDAAEVLRRLADHLGEKRQQFDREVTQPLQQLELVVPLMADQSRYLELAAWQDDLAQRLSSLRGRDGQDDPAIGARMRELQREQQDLHEALGQWLDDVDNHVERLPQRPEFNKLRRTALEFVAKVRTSGAQGAMAQAETGLAEFSGTRGYDNARSAADILNKFIGHCNQMGGEGRSCLAFQPALSGRLGNTLSQLMSAMGGGGGSGSLAYGSRGALYGDLPGMTGQYGSGYGPKQRGRGRGGAYDAAGQAATWSDPSAGHGAGGAGEAAVPLRYRRSVGRYFQRITEELGGSR
jgi:hypothetical protein